MATKKARLRIQTEGDTSGSEKVKKSLKDVISTASKLAYGIKKITDYTDKYVSSQRVLNMTFGETTKEINTYIKSMKQMTGISETSLSNQISLFGQTAKSLGLTNEAAEKYAKNITSLSSKIAILQGLSFEDVSKSLRDAAKGESSTLATLTGIVVKTQSLQNTLANLGIDRQASSLNAAEMAMVQYMTVARMVNTTNEDLSKSVNSVAWQKMLLKQQVADLATAFGKFLYPILQAILPVLNAVLMVLTNIITVFAKLIGYKDSIAETVSGASSSFTSLGENATKAAKAVNKSLRGFDKLNTISTPKETSAGGSSALSVDPKIATAFGQMNDQLTDIENKATAIADTIMKWLGFSKDVNGEWEWSITNVLKNLWDSLTNIKGLIATIGIVGAIVGISKLIKKIKEIKGASQKSSVAANLMAKGFKNLATGLGMLAGLAGVALVIKEIANLIDTYSESGVKADEVTQLLITAFGSMAVAFGIMAAASKLMDWTGIVGAVVLLGGMVLVIKQINDLLETLSKTGMDVTDVSAGLAGMLAAVVAAMAAMAIVAYALSTNPLALLGLLALVASISAILLVMKETLPTILDACSKFINSIAPFIIELISTIYDGIEKLILALGTTLPPIIDSVGGVFEKVFGGMEGVIRAIGDTISNIMRTAKNLVVEVLNAILNFINKLGPAINNFVDGVCNAVTKLINFVISGIEYMINTLIIGSINKLIKTITSGALGEALELLGVEIKTVAKVKIERFKPTYYENGGFPSEGELFIAREKGAELVGNMNGKTAVANNDQIVKGIEEASFQGMMRALSASGGRNTKVEITAEGDTSGLLDFITFSQKKKNRRNEL